MLDGFNPRTRDGCEMPRFTDRTVIERFNPRTRDGCELAWLANTPYVSCFNPRTRDGCEDEACGIDDAVMVSIHAPVMGAKFGYLWLRLFTMFQSTHP